MNLAELDTKKLAVTAGAGLVFFLVTIFLVFKLTSPVSKAKGPPAVLIVGPSGAGKTALFLSWQEPDAKKDTVVSISPNEAAQFALDPKYRVIDCPGNERLQQYTRTLLTESNVKAVVFVVDASSGAEGIKFSAEPLFAVLEITEARQIPVLISANKFDLFSTLSVPKVKSLLEQEISELRDTRSHTVPSSEDEKAWTDTEFLGVDGKPFEFSDLESEVDVLDGSVKTHRLSKWEDWLTEVLSR